MKQETNRFEMQQQKIDYFLPEEDVPADNKYMPQGHDPRHINHGKNIPVEFIVNQPIFEIHKDIERVPKGKKEEVLHFVFVLWNFFQPLKFSI